MNYQFPFSRYHKESVIKTELFIESQFGVSRRKIYSSSRQKHILGARYVAYYILYKIFYFPSPLVGSLFDKSHNSVLNGIHQVISWGWEEEIVRQFAIQYPSTDNKKIEWGMNKLSDINRK